MDSNQIDQLLIAYSSKIPAESMPMVRERLLSCDSMTTASAALCQLKDPTIALVLSICLGGFGVDRFYIGDAGLGVGKLLTCGGVYIWWFIDLFLIMDATRKKNLNTLLFMMR